jgi:voltage-dependent calcium channel
MNGHREHLSTSSTSSAVDLAGSPTGLATVPSSPALGPQAATSVARRRTSWGGSDDPFRMHISHPDTVRSYNLDEDPFSPTNSDHGSSENEDDMQTRSRYEHTSTYLTAQSGPSSTSLMHATFLDEDESNLYLTSNISQQDNVGRNLHDLTDPERTPGSTPRSRKISNRYGTTPSPLSKTGESLRTVSRNLRQMSLRVVNFAGVGLDDHIRLADDDSEKTSPSFKGKDHGMSNNDDREQDALPDLRKRMPLRGRTLGFLGTTNSVRLAMYRFLLAACVFPTLRFTMDLIIP